MDDITDFKPDRTGRVLMLRWPNGEYVEYPQVGWLVISDPGDERQVTAGYWDQDSERVRTSTDIRRFMPSGFTYDFGVGNR